MPGVAKHHPRREFGRAFPASRYDDPRGGLPSALERNILRYRATEATLYLFYAEEVRNFILETIYPAAVRRSGEVVDQRSDKQRLQHLFTEMLNEAERENKLSSEDALAIRLAFAEDRQQGKKLKLAIGYAISIGILTQVEAAELRRLLQYRNDIAHRIHFVMSDLSKSYEALGYIAYFPPTYKGDALERLNAYRRLLWERARSKLTLILTMDGALFELAERTLEQDLARLDMLIKKQIIRERERYDIINLELNLSDTELVGDLSPRFPANHRPGCRGYGDDYVPATGHLTKRGIEICYRLFDMGKSPIAVAYLMGMTLRSAERRQRSWIKAGGSQRIQCEVERFDADGA